MTDQKLTPRTLISTDLAIHLGAMLCAVLYFIIPMKSDIDALKRAAVSSEQFARMDSRLENIELLAEKLERQLYAQGESIDEIEDRLRVFEILQHNPKEADYENQAD